MYNEKGDYKMNITLILKIYLRVLDLWFIYPDVVIVFVFVLKVIVNTGVVVDDVPVGTEAELLEYIIDGPVPVPMN